jgi:hypothetical protein
VSNFPCLLIADGSEKVQTHGALFVKKCNTTTHRDDFSECVDDDAYGCLRKFSGSLSWPRAAGVGQIACTKDFFVARRRAHLACRLIWEIVASSGLERPQGAGVCDKVPVPVATGVCISLWTGVCMSPDVAKRILSPECRFPPPFWEPATELFLVGWGTLGDSLAIARLVVECLISLAVPTFVCLPSVTARIALVP